MKPVQLFSVTMARMDRKAELLRKLIMEELMSLNNDVYVRSLASNYITSVELPVKFLADLTFLTMLHLCQGP